jgi:hypothetical protein
MRDNSKDPTPYAVLCDCQTGGNGDDAPVFLTKKQYMVQLNNPDYPWKCPKCGSCAEWDDECQEPNPPEDQETA